MSETAAFAAAVNYRVGDRPHSVFSADLDGDSNNDLAVANFYSNNISVLPNNGDGTFAPVVYYATGKHPTSVFSADLDADGDYDLAAANYNSDNVSILINRTTEPVYICGDVDGDGKVTWDDLTFLWDFYFHFGDRPLPYWSGDLNLNGGIDIADLVWLADYLNGTATPPCYGGSFRRQAREAEIQNQAQRN